MKTKLKKHIEPIGNAINGYVVMKGIQFNQTTKSEVHHTGKDAKIKTTTTTRTFTANEIIGDNKTIIETINQLKNDKS